MLENIFFILVGSLAGFIDSIAGGGGLITLPVLTHALSDYTLAIGTNKIPGSFAAGLAFLLYSRKTSFPKKSDKLVSEVKVKKPVPMGLSFNITGRIKQNNVKYYIS